jgi:RNA polymerase sigma-70 factor (ECF subfamily)
VNPTAGLDDLTDEELIHLVVERDESAFRALYRRHSPRLKSVVSRLLARRPHDVEDVLQETWLAACRSLRAFRGDAKFSTWLASIGLRIAWRRLRADPVAEVGLDDSLRQAPASETDRLDLERSLTHLSDSQRAVLVLHDAQGFTHDEIGALLGIPAGTSRSLLTRGRRLVRQLLKGTHSHES